MKGLLVLAAVLLTLTAQALETSCFMVKVEGREDIAIMMATLNKERGVVYKVKSDETGRIEEASFHIFAFGEKIAERLYKKYTSRNGSFNKYVTVIAAQKPAGKNSCDIYNTIESDL